MTETRKAQFSLLTLILAVTIAALLLSNVTMVRWLRQARVEVERARAEVEETRRRYGYLEVTDQKLIHVSRIEGGDSSWGNSYRLHIPPGNRFLLHIGEGDISDEGEFELPQPAKSLSMNNWAQGADLILHWDIQYGDDGIPHLKVATETDQLFDYPITTWKLGPGPGDGAHLTTGPQKTFRPDEIIRFMWERGDISTKRGVLFWMEPTSRRYPKQ